jgi:AcrR family transcriptional regulator
MDAPAEGSRVERKKEDTRRKVLETALGLFRQHGYDAVTMEQIAAQADIAKGTLYNYFPVKEAILDEYIRRSFREHAVERSARIRSLPDTRARMTSILNDLITGIRAQQELFERYFTYRIQRMIALKQDESAASGLDQLEIEIIRLGQQNGELRADLPFNLLMALFEFTFVEIAQLFYRDPASFDALSAVEQCVELFMNGARRAEKER